MTRRRTWLVLGFVAVLAACGEERAPPQAAPRPVTWFKLAVTDPSTLARHTGSVESWKKELIGFEVGGRVDFVTEPGLDVEGRVEDLEGRVVSEGEVVGRLDRTRYRITVEQAKANVASAKAQSDVTRRMIDSTLPQEIRQAREDRDFKEREFQRYAALAGKGVESKADYDLARTAFRKAEAAVAQISARLTEKAAELASQEAAAMRAERNLHQAEEDLRDCDLYSPFTGQIAKVHVIPGGYVTKGQPVITVQMMDPMKVEIAVSSQADERIHLNDFVPIYVGGREKPLEGSVYLKATVADSATRTFMVTLLVRNASVEVGTPQDVIGKDAVAVTLLTGPITEVADGPPPYFIREKAIHRDGEGTYVWVADGMTRPDLYDAKAKSFKLKKVRITLGEAVIPILQLVSYHEVADLGPIDPKKDLIALGVPDDTAEGADAYFSRKVWMLRPGQLVHVDLKRGTLPVGLYVPMNAVAVEGDKRAVFVVEDGEDGTEVARRIEVKLHETFGEFRRVEPVSGGALDEGARVVLGGTHYLRDGDAINAFDEVEVKP